MRTRVRVMLSLLTAVGFAVGSLLAVGLGSGLEAAKKPSESSVEFRQGVRKLWEDHITWTRCFMISFAADLDDQDATAGRLFQNQSDIGNAFKPFYGGPAGDQLAGLLNVHIQGAVEVLTAARDDPDALEGALSAWYENGEDIASFLHSANPTFWPLEQMRQQVEAHLDLTVLEAIARLNGDYPSDIAAYDAVHNQILGFADIQSSGIISQFPQQFKFNQ